MGVQDLPAQVQYCPDLTSSWHLGQRSGSDQIVLTALKGNRQLLFSAAEGFALRYFTGTFTVAQVQGFCEQEYNTLIGPTFVLQLIDALIKRRVIPSDGSNGLDDPQVAREFLKPHAHWIEHPDGYWILRNPEDVTFLQVSAADRQIIQQLALLSPDQVMQRDGVPPQAIERLMGLLAATGMLVGTTPAKPSKRPGFNPLQLLFFRLPLFNPDTWLSQHIGKLNWIWTREIAWVLTVFLVASTILGWNYQTALVTTGQKLWAMDGAILLIPFILLCGLVVALHELAHAFTLKHYGGIVPEIGLLVMCLMPGCYTNTTDSYCLVKRRQRLIVVGAGILCQWILWAIGLWLWLVLTPGTWVHTGSYLLMVAALFTLAVNLNPLAKFDGYYLAVAATGINNLRSRSFLFYFNRFAGKPVRERGRDQIMFALYAPLSLLYTLFVFGHLLWWLVEWCLTHIPTLSLALLLLWGLLHFLPKFLSQASTMTSHSAQSKARPPLQVVPPHSPQTQRSESFPEAIAQPELERSQPAAPAIDSKASRFPKRLVILGLISLGMVGIGLIPLTDTVTGDATIGSTSGQRQVVTMARAAQITAIYVRQNDRVRPGQLLAELSSHELQQQGIEVERKLAEARGEWETTQQYFKLATEKEVGAQVKTQHGKLRADLLREELEQLKAGQASPRIRQLQSQQTEKQRQIQGVEAQLLILSGQIDRYSELVREGALPLAKVDELRREAIALQTQQATLKAQIETLGQQIATTQKEMRDDLIGRRQPEVEESQTTALLGQQEISAARATLQKWAGQIALLERQQQQILGQQNGLKLRATVAGVVTTPDLDVLEGQKLPEGKEVLTIAAVSQPTVRVELPQSDAVRVKVGMPVTLRIQDAGLEGYRAVVQDIPPITATENPQQPQQKPLVQVKVRLEEGQPFTLGTKGYAHVQLGQVFLYQKVGRELLKLIPVGRFF